MKKERHVKMNLIEVNGGHRETTEFVFNLFGVPTSEAFMNTFGKFDVRAPLPNFVVLREGFFDIKNVIFHDPATIVFWGDGTKTVVKALDEPYDPEKGLAMAIAKHFFGNKWDYYNQFLHWLKKYKVEEENVDMSFDSITEAFRNLDKALGDYGKDK